MSFNFFEHISNLSCEKFITGSNFAKNSDIVYSEATNYKGFKSLQTNNIESYSKVDNDIYIYSIKNFEIEENQIIFCKTDYLLDLFSKLKKVKLKNVKLITHQAATPKIDEKLFKLKPKCISLWYAINVEFENDKLVPIPLGLNSFYSKSGLKPENYKNSGVNKLQSKKNKIYTSFNLTTNKKRKYYLDFAKKNKIIFNIESNRVNEMIYFNKLKEHKYIFCPPGVGEDTHRFWEAIYAGSIPIAEKNYIYDKYFRNYYISFEKIENINLSSLKEKNFNQELLNMLNIDFWFSKLKSVKINSNECESVNLSNSDFQKRRNKLRKKYVRYKIYNSKVSYKNKIYDYFDTYFNFNEKLFFKYWH